MSWACECECSCSVDTEWLTYGCILVFEGAAHPYKDNLIKFDGRTGRKELQMKTKVLEQKSI